MYNENVLRITGTYHHSLRITGTYVVFLAADVMRLASAQEDERWGVSKFN